MKVVVAVFSVGKRVDFRPFDVFRPPCWPKIIDHWGWRDQSPPPLAIREGISTKSPRGRKKRRTWRGMTCCAKKSENGAGEEHSGSEFWRFGGSKLSKLAAEPVTGHPDMTLLVGEATEMKEKLWRSCGGKVGRLCLGDFCGELAEWKTRLKRNEAFADSRDHPILSGEPWLRMHIDIRVLTIDTKNTYLEYTEKYVYIYIYIYSNWKKYTSSMPPSMVQFTGMHRESRNLQVARGGTWGPVPLELLKHFSTHL